MSALTVTDWIAAPSITEHGRHEHVLGTIVGYQVVVTAWDAAGVTRTATDGVYAANRYAAALDLAQELRSEQARAGLRDRMYVLVDTLYACGCRSDRVTS